MRSNKTYRGLTDTAPIQVPPMLTKHAHILKEIPSTCVFDEPKETDPLLRQLDDLTAMPEFLYGDRYRVFKDDWLRWPDNMLCTCRVFCWPISKEVEGALRLEGKKPYAVCIVGGNPEFYDAGMGSLNTYQHTRTDMVEVQRLNIVDEYESACNFLLAVRDMAINHLLTAIDERDAR